MPLLPNRVSWPHVLRMTALTCTLWAGPLFAEPPRRALPSLIPVVPINDELSQTTTDELGEYIELLERHLDWMHERAVWRKDSETLRAVAAIRKKLVIAKDHHRALCRLCAEELRDTPMARACCQKIDDLMHEVIDDHLALMRRLRARHTSPPRTRRIKADTHLVPPLPRGQRGITSSRHS